MAEQITIDRLVSGFGQLDSDIKRGLLKQAGTAGALEIRNEARTRVVRRTSNLMRNINAVVTKSNATEVEVEIGPSVKYGEYVEKGTGVYGPNRKPFVVKVKTAKALRWITAQGIAISKAGKVSKRSAGNKYAFAKEVTIQGMKPRPYMVPAFEAKQEDAAQTAMAVIWSGVERALA